ncbi:hypothetical protein IMCC26207_105147 [Actinobacteria bacterium IMCC26207]|nr:hypothetical protein IMCC26207_105147 [Actinobacteria bacterium IMCC26207]
MNVKTPLRAPGNTRRPNANYRTQPTPYGNSSRSGTRTTRQVKPPSRLSRLMIWALWTGALAAALALLLRSGGFFASTPPLQSGSEFRNWFLERDPLDVAASAGRLIAILLLGYLLVVSSIQAFALRGQRQHTQSLAVRLAPRFLLFFTAGLMASTSTAFAATAAYAAEPDQPEPSTAPMMQVVDAATPFLDLQPVNPSQARTSLPWASNSSPGPAADESQNAEPPPTAAPIPAPAADLNAATDPSSAPEAAPSAAPTMNAQVSTSGLPSQQSQQSPRGQPGRQGQLPGLLGLGATATPSAQAPDPSTQPTTTLPTTSLPTTAAPATGTPGSAQQTVPYTVIRGDNFWRISEQVLQMRLGSQPSASQIAQYSAQLISNNQEALIDPENPGLILVGQVFQLP